MFGIAAYSRRWRLLPWQVSLQTTGIGCIVALHWVCFFQAVKVSNVSVALGCLASSTLFTSLIEPLIERRKVRSIEVFIGVVIIIGLYIITQFAFHYWQGILFALAAAFLATVFSVLNRRLVQQYDPLLIASYEMSTGCAAITLYVLGSGGFSTPIAQILPTDWLCIAFLAFVCTGYAFTAITALMRRLSAFTVNLAINLEPVYGIILAYFVFGDTERMHLGFYVGALLILAAVLGYPFLLAATEQRATINK